MNYVQTLHVGDRYIFRLCIGDDLVQKETNNHDTSSPTSQRSNHGIIFQKQLPGCMKCTKQNLDDVLS